MEQLLSTCVQRIGRHMRASIQKTIESSIALLTKHERGILCDDFTFIRIIIPSSDPATN